MSSKWSNPNNYVITPVQSVSYIDLAEETEKATVNGETVELFRVEIVNEDGYVDPVAGAMAWFPASGRAGLAWGGDADWVDATSPENAIANFAAAEQIEED